MKHDSPSGFFAIKLAALRPGVLVVIVFLMFNIFGANRLTLAAIEQRIKSEAENDSWWAERAALFFPRYHFTLSPTSSASFTDWNIDLASSVTRAPDAPLAVRTWDGGGANDNWDTILNWDNNLLPAATDDVVFGTAFTSGTSIDLNGNRTVNSLTINTTTAFSIADNTLTLTSGTLTRNSASSGDQIISSAVNISAAAVWDIQGSGTLTISGVINETSGTLNLTKNGSGTLVLSANNQFGGALILNAGILRGTGDADALGDGTLTLAGGILELANNAATDFANNTTVTGSMTIRSDRTSAGAGVTHALGTLSIGAQTLTIDKGSFVTSGIAGVAFDATTLSASGAVFDVATGASLTLASVTGTNRNFTVQGAGNTTITGNIATGTGSLTKNGAGTLTVNATGTTNSGGIIINGGVFATNVGDYFGPSGAPEIITINAGTLRYDATYTTATNRNAITLGDALSTIDVGSTFSYAPGVVSGSGTLNKTGAGTLLLDRANTYLGGTTLSAGTLNLASPGTLGSTTGTLTVNGGTLNVGGTSQTVGALNGSGGTILNNGAATSLTAGNGGASGAYSGVIANGTANLGFIKTGSGTQTLSGTNTYDGATAVNAGTLLINGNQSGATGAVSVTNAGSVLGGTGTIGGAVTVNANAKVQGGNGTTGTTLTLGGALTLATDSIIQLALGPSGTHSTLARTGSGTWTFASAQDFNFLDLGATAGLYDNIITGLAGPPNTLPATWTINNPGWTGTFTFDGGVGPGNIDLTLVAVPEPSTWTSGALLVGLIGWSQRRRFARLVRRAA